LGSSIDEVKKSYIAGGFCINAIFCHATKRSDADAAGYEYKRSLCVSWHHEVARQPTRRDSVPYLHVPESLLVGAGWVRKFYSQAQDWLSRRGRYREGAPIPAGVKTDIWQGPVEKLSGKVAKLCGRIFLVECKSKVVDVRRNLTLGLECEYEASAWIDRKGKDITYDES
jgi:hypothetical protein